MNLGDIGLPLPKQEGKILDSKKYSGFGYSLRGKAHIERDTPCQDFSDLRYVEGCDVVIACISDGVGSCVLSHWGAQTAVTTAVAFVEQKVHEIAGNRKFDIKSNRSAIPAILHDAFQEARNAVEDLADAHGRPPAEFQSTLTLALYDGVVLCCEHAGDDGAVAQFQSGVVDMVTERVKGEEASSVYPLQAGPKFWKYTESGMDGRGPVVAFTMATDGVLDMFAFEEQLFKETPGCCGGIYYPLMAPMVYGDSNKGVSSNDVSGKMSLLKNYMNSEGYRKRVADDLTVVSVVNLSSLKKAKTPQFSAEAFNAASQEIVRRRNEILYGSIAGGHPAQPMPATPAGSGSGAPAMGGAPYGGDEYNPNAGVPAPTASSKNKVIVGIVAAVVVVAIAAGVVASQTIMKPSSSGGGVIAGGLQNVQNANGDQDGSSADESPEASETDDSTDESQEATAQQDTEANNKNAGASEKKMTGQPSIKTDVQDG